MHGREENEEGQSRKIPAGSEWRFRYLGRQRIQSAHTKCIIAVLGCVGTWLAFL